MRYFLVLILILVGFISIDAPSAQAGSITVNGTCTLVDAIIAANTDAPSGDCPAGSGADVITLDVGVLLTSPDMSSSLLYDDRAGLPDITTDITIQAGAADIISGNSTNYRIFNVVGGTLTLDGITVSGGKVSRAGGGIFVESTGTLSLIDAIVTGNMVTGGTATSYGGGIYNVGTISRISASIISNNHVQPDPVTGSGLIALGGGIYSTGTLTTLNTSLITGNSVTGGDSTALHGGRAVGGGIYAVPCGSIEVTTISNNQAIGGTGASNAGGSAGAGGLLCGNSGFLKGAVISGNLSAGGNSQGFGGDAWGGGLTTYGLVSLISVEITSNVTKGGSGSTIGGTAWGGGALQSGDSEDGLGTMDLLTVSGNEAIGGGGPTPGNAYGGGMYLGVLPPTIGIADFAPERVMSLLQDGYITRSTFTGNHVHIEDGTTGHGNAFGGGLHVASTKLLGIRDTSFSNNSAQGSNNSNGTAGDGIGGGLYVAHGDLTNVTVSHNTTQGGNGSTDGLGLGGGIAIGGSVDILNSTVSNNSAETEGGGLFIDALDETIAINFSTILNNSAALDGEVLSIADGTVNITNNILASAGAVPDCSMALGNTTGSENLRIANDTSCDTLATGIIQIGTHIDETLQNNGGPTDTHALLNVGGNPAVNAIGICGLTFDQRGFLRDLKCDVGSYELQAEPAPTDTPIAPTDTPMPPTDTTVPPTNTPIPPTDTTVPPTNTPIIATDTPMSPTETPITPTDTSVPPSDTPGPTTLEAFAVCVDANLAVTISAGDGPFNITASAGINTPVMDAGIGTTIINGPEKWDNLTVTETSGNGESLNLGQFKCRTDERPVPLVPAHRAHVTDPTPTFSWAGISNANNYRVFIFDDKVVADRTVDIRQNSGGPTYLTLNTPLPDGRLFWRVRGRQNRVWSLWSVRFTLFKDPVPPLMVPTAVPTIELDSPPTVAPQTTFQAPQTATPLPPPPNSR